MKRIILLLSSSSSSSLGMADSKAVSTSLLILPLLLLLVLLHEAGAEADELLRTAHERRTTASPQIDCAGACAGRCRLASRQKMCKRACGTCCNRCKCVPPGSSGNREVCPCYASMITHGGRLKCP